MSRAGLSRREFLNFLWISAVSSAVAACQGLADDSPTPGKPTILPTQPILPTATMTNPTSQPTSTHAPATGSIQLNGQEADVWAWETRAAGKITGSISCEQVQVDVSGQKVPAEQTGTEFTAQIPIGEGENQITAICAASTGEQRSQTLVYTGRLQKRPAAVIQPSIDNGLLVLDGQQSHAKDPGGAAVQEYSWSARAGNPAPVQVVDASGKPGQEWSQPISGEMVRVALPETDGEYYFNLQVTDGAGVKDSAGTYVVVENGQLRIPDYDRENPVFMESTIVYGVVPKMFNPPGCKGIINRLDDLQDLGINALWLAPINVSPVGDYGYAVKDYFNLSRSFGSKDDFHLLVQEAHARGIRVLMDFVPNHSSDQHPYYQDRQAFGKESPYWDFYDHDASGEVTHYFDWTYLPNHNYDNPDVRRYITEAFSYWVREFDVDGFRVDVAWGVKERRPDYWPEWRKELKRIKPDLLLLAEAGARDPYYFDNGFDAAYDWTSELGHWAWEKVWTTYKNNTLIPYLEMALTNYNKGFHPDAVIFRFLNNNDTGQRFITKYGPEMARVATAMLLSLPGLPCVYTGDEYGEEFHPYEDSLPLRWAEKVPGIRDYHKRLVGLRKELPSLHSRNWSIVEVTPGPKVYAYIRHLPDKSQPVLVLLNFFPEDLDVAVDLPEEFRSLAKAGQLHDLLADEIISTQGSESLKLKLPGMRAMLLAQ